MFSKRFLLLHIDFNPYRPSVSVWTFIHKDSSGGGSIASLPGGCYYSGLLNRFPESSQSWMGRVSYPFSCTSLVQPQKHEEDSTSGSILVRKLLQFLFTVNLRQETIKKNKWDLHKVAAANKKKDVSTFPPSTLRCYVKIYIRRRRRNNNNYTFLRCCCKVLQAADFRKWLGGEGEDEKWISRKRK